MTQQSTMADRASSLALGVLAAINILFLLAFMATLMFGSGQAYAQDTVQCTGSDMLAEMERDDPDRLALIRAEASNILNGEAVLWKVEKDGIAASWLFGTMHMSDPRVLTLGAGAQAAFDASSTVVIETTDVLDQSKMMAAMMAQPELMMFTDDTTLMSLFSQDDRETVEDALSKRGIPPASVAKMKPWMLGAMVSLPACELARKAAGAPVLDTKLAADAKDAGKALKGLETVTDQLGAMASLPMEFHIQGLVDTLKLGDRMDDVIETMIVLYLEGETGTFWPFFRAALPSDGNTEEGFAAFEEAMITARNKTMAERAEPILNEGGAFVAVGALHLPGDDGLVALLRADGYRLTPER
ncbi:TraB/GumN family protein [Mesorhizobium sp. CAU 1732]|uniref:TraB/GumN family protein n=1 Tax=Mesorhizobium sp. CAU 1732 TaxID=3140358 RepID=UPI0032605181